MSAPSVSPARRSGGDGGSTGLENLRLGGVGTTLQIVGEQLAEACDLRCDDRVLDVAAGNGNATLAAARRGAHVVSTDHAPGLLQRGAERAAAERLDVRFQVAAAERLPFPEHTFHAVLSSFGVMFARDHARAAAELVRVSRWDARIGLAAWTPDGFVGRMADVLSRFVPPPVGALSPLLWGDEAHLRRLFAGLRVRATPRRFAFRYRSAPHFVGVLRDVDGPLHETFLALPADRAQELEQELIALAVRWDGGRSGSFVVPADYLEVVVTRR